MIGAVGARSYCPVVEYSLEIGKLCTLVAKVSSGGLALELCARLCFQSCWCSDSNDSADAL
jgi:hypothetical protein